jgi:hypothetical protein
MVILPWVLATLLRRNGCSSFQELLTRRDSCSHPLEPALPKTHFAMSAIPGP